jgi:dUTP pyrophosphatase
MRKMKSEEVVEIKAFRDGVVYPVKSTSNAAGYDVHAWCLDSYDNQILVTANDTKLIKTGLNVNIPKGYEVQVRSRSGLAANNSVVVLNSPGTVDCDFSPSLSDNFESYEVKVILHNHSKNGFVVKHGDRVAQLVICKLPEIEFKVVDEFSTSANEDREGGFGSTGV